MAFAAIARAAAKAAGKAKAARAKKAGDTATKARKRYYRAAERELRKAEQSSGATAGRFRQLARIYFKDALSTYDPTKRQAFSKPIRRLADEFGINLDEYRKSLSGGNIEQAISRREKMISRSEDILESSLRDTDKRREREARALLSDDAIGSRVMGGFVEIWGEEATYTDASTGKLKVDNKKIMSKMMDYFDVDNVADLLDKIEDIAGEDLYASPEDYTQYQIAKLKIQNYVAERMRIV